MSFRVMAAGGSKAIDRTEVRRALKVLIGPGEYHELRGLGRSASGQSYAASRLIKYDDWESACDAAYDLSDGIGVYYSLNPVAANLGDRGASAKHVLLRRWLLIDVDRKKLVEPDQSATQAEKDSALSLGCCICDWLISEGWPAPVLSDSGNGCHLLFRLDLPADDLARLLLQRTLRALAARWHSPDAEIDPKVYDAPRIARLPGTWARKGIPTDDRPHRLCRLLHVPHELEVVTVEMLEAVAGNEAPTAKTYNPNSFKIKVTSGIDRRQAYVQIAVERELARLALMGAGNRNNALNAAAFSIGTIVGASAFDRGEAERRLADAGRQTGLPDAEIARTIRSGLDAGAAKPRAGIPDAGSGPKTHTNGTPKGPTVVGKKLTIRLKDVKPEKVDWFYENRVAPGFISIFAGRTGFGKSFVTCDIVGKLSLGFSPPFSSCVHPPMRTLIISEDSPGLVIAPRLHVMGTDPEMVDFMTWEALAAYSLGDTDMLELAYQECGCPPLIVIDPPSNFLGGADANKESEIRPILKLLIAWLDTHHVACIFIMHINKQSNQNMDAVERIVGSVAWGSSARITCAFVRDPDVADQFLFGGTKNNVGPTAETLAYKFGKNDDGNLVIDWVGKTATTMEAAMNSTKKKPRGVLATEVLLELFRQKSEWEAEELHTAARQAGISRQALWSPEVNALPIIKRRRGNAAGEVHWFWRASPGWPPDIVGTVGTLAP